MADEQDEIIIYQTGDGKNKIDVKLEGKTVWLTQAQLVELYQSRNPMSVNILSMFMKKVS